MADFLQQVVSAWCYAKHSEFRLEEAHDTRSPTKERQRGREPLRRRYVRNNLLKTDRQRCAMTTVSALMAEHDLQGIDLLKIDVEGAELDVLRGIRLEDWPRIHQACPPACRRPLCHDAFASKPGAAGTQEQVYAVQLIMSAHFWVHFRQRLALQSRFPFRPCQDPHAALPFCRCRRPFHLCCRLRCPCRCPFCPCDPFCVLRTACPGGCLMSSGLASAQSGAGCPGGGKLRRGGMHSGAGCSA